MWSNKRAFIPSFVVGILGAKLATILIFSEGSWWILYGWAKHIAHLQLPAAVIIGFLTCFFISLWFLKLMRGKHWGVGTVFGILLGIMAGAIIAYLVALYGYIIEGLKWGFAHNFVIDWVMIPFIAAMFGASVGASVGLLLSLVFGPWLLKIINKPATKQG